MIYDVPRDQWQAFAQILHDRTGETFGLVVEMYADAVHAGQCDPGLWAVLWAVAELHGLPTLHAPRWLEDERRWWPVLAPSDTRATA